MIDDLIATWLINNRVDLLLLKELTEDGLQTSLSSRGGRTVGQQLAHLYEVRRSTVEAADESLAKDLPRVGREQGHDKKALSEAFRLSGDAVAELIRRSGMHEGRVKGFRRGIVALIGYFIAHDSHHRGHILLTMKQKKVKRSDRLKMGIWDWNKI